MSSSSSVSFHRSRLTQICEMLIDCLLSKRQISMFKYSMKILINHLQSLSKIWFLFNQRFSMIILCCSRWVINRNIISFLCSCIMINVYKACVIDFQSEISSYNWINFDFDSDIDWISKRSQSSDIKDSSMKVMSVTSVSIRVWNLNIFSRLFKIMSTVNDLKLDWSRRVESSRSSRVFNSSRLDLSQNSWLEYLSWIEMFDSSIQVESESWNRVSTRNTRLDSSRHEDR